MICLVKPSSQRFLFFLRATSENHKADEFFSRVSNKVYLSGTVYVLNRCEVYLSIHTKSIYRTVGTIYHIVLIRLRGTVEHTLINNNGRWGTQDDNPISSNITVILNNKVLM